MHPGFAVAMQPAWLAFTEFIFDASTCIDISVSTTL